MPPLFGCLLLFSIMFCSAKNDYLHVLPYVEFLALLNLILFSWQALAVYHFPFICNAGNPLCSLPDIACNAPLLVLPSNHVQFTIFWCLPLSFQQ